MKTRNVLYLIALLLTFTNCSNNDDTENTEATSPLDPIIGKWRATKKVENGSEISITSCATQDFLTYRNDGTITDTYYEPNSETPNTCREFIDTSGRWEKLTDTRYIIRLDDGDLTYTASVIFLENNTIQTQTYIVTDGGENENYVDTYERLP